MSGTHGRTEADPAGNTGFWGVIPCEFRHSLVVSKSEERQPGLIAPSRIVKSCKGNEKTVSDSQMSSIQQIYESQHTCDSKIFTKETHNHKSSIHFELQLK